MHVENIKHYHYIDEQLASSGQPQAHEFEAIASNGYQVIVNLAMHNSSNAVLEEEAIVTALKMSYVHLPVPFDAPTTHHLRAFFEVMRNHKTNKVWVHCALNYRASAFLYQYYRMVLNQSDSKARDVMLPSWEPNKVWQQFLALNADDV